GRWRSAFTRQQHQPIRRLNSFRFRLPCYTLRWGTEQMTLSDNPIGASYLYLSEPEIRFLEAAVEHLIPTDELGPGARDAGVVVYVDRALASTWGVHGRQYRGGPWLEGTPQQGYQSRFTPRGRLDHVHGAGQRRAERRVPGARQAVRYKHRLSQTQRVRRTEVRSS